MNTYDCVMLGLECIGLIKLHEAIMDNYGEYLNYDKIAESNWRTLVETSPHVTIIYGLNPGLGYNNLYYQLKLKNRESYLRLRKGNVINIKHPIINTFDNEDCKVLKIDFNQCDAYTELNQLMKDLSEFPNDWQYKDNYNPHLTLTYLTKDAPDSIAKELTDKYSAFITDFITTGYIVSSNEGSLQERII